MRFISVLTTSLLFTGIVYSQQISAGRIRAHTRFLSSDLIEGRGVGTRGGQLTTEYLAAQFELAGAEPAGDDRTYFQQVVLAGVQTKPESALVAEAGGRVVELKWMQDFVGATERQSEEADFAGDVIFMGHGITSSEFDWNDYGDLDVRGKVLVLFTNEPPSQSPEFFGGRALTYYGRWTYKFEQAARKGAAAALLIHTDETAGYGWDVVRNSWGRESVQVKYVAGTGALGFAGWVTREAGERLLKLGGHSVDELLRKADKRGFQPIPLPVRIRGSLHSQVREIRTRNVAAKVPGSDPGLRDEAVVLSAHWDHLGVGPEVDGDRIYNGAVDNATGCALLLEMARAWATLNTPPRRTALFLAVTAEESGLLGSKYYTQDPIVAAGKTVAALNFDAYLPTGRPTSIVVNGAERTTLWPLVQDAARRRELEIKPDQRPEQGGYFRSDHFPFAQAGVPAFSVNMGGDYLGKAPEESRLRGREFAIRHYHRPSDEFREEWDFRGLADIGEFGLLLGRTVADLDTLPGWKAGDPLEKVRQANRP